MSITRAPAPAVHVLRGTHTQYEFRPLPDGRVYVGHLDLTRGGVWLGSYTMPAEEARGLWKRLLAKGYERGN